MSYIYPGESFQKDPPPKRYGEHRLTGPEWLEQNDKACKAFLNGQTTLTVPDDAHTINADFGVFIQIQPQCWLDQPPSGYIISTRHSGQALKILLPTTPKPGDKIRITGPSKSGKSYHARIE